MKETLKNTAAVPAFRETAVAVGIHITVAILGFLAARAPILDSLVPFGIAFAAAMPKGYIFTAGIGAFFGYFFPAVSGSGFRYLAAVFAVCTIKALVYGVTTFAKKPLFSALIAFLATLTTNLAAATGGNISYLYSIAEAVLSGAAGYFAHRAVSIVSKEKAGFTAEQLAAVLIMANIVLLGLYPVTFFSVSIGRILAAAAVMCAAVYARAGGGAVCGSLCALFLLLYNKDYAATAVILSVGGVLGGMFSRLGKFCVCGAFLLWSAVGALLIGGDISSFLLLVEVAFGAAVCTLLPSDFCVKMGKMLSPPVHIPSLDGLRRAITMRLFFASDALADVSQTVHDVSHELSLINAPDFSWVLESVHADACRGCTLSAYCWERKKQQTHDAIMFMTKLIKSGEEDIENAAPAEWQDRCLRTARVGNSLKKYYGEYSSLIAAETRIEEIRSVVSDQFSGISTMLFELGREFETTDTFDTSLAASVSSALKDIDIRAEDCACRRDKYGRIQIELRVCMPKTAVLNRLQILQIAEAVCGRDFEPPAINRARNETFIRISEKANYTAQIGVSQFAAGGGSVCGDAYTYFNDGNGRLILILSDGMGTGGRAAVDGAMASGLMERLLKAGFGYDCALRIVNSSLLFKSTDESLATLDIASIDLYTGKCELLKVGAAPTVLRRGNRTGKAQSTSLPAGILRDIGFDKAAVTLKQGDIVLLLSDGAVSEGTDWICAELESFKDGRAEDLAEKIAQGARRRRTDGHEDDITVIAAILEKTI